MVTRAIGLMIIIGHKETLMKNADWKAIIDYTVANCNGEMVVRYDGWEGDKKAEDEEEEEYDYRC